MTWRAFIIGLLAVALIAAVVPENDFVLKNTYITGNHFPAGAFFILVVLTLGVNVLIKLVRRAWALRRAELMLVWCMMIVSCTVPASGLMRYWFSIVAAPAYYGSRPDLHYDARVLPNVPADLVLSKDPRSVAARRFFEGPAVGESPRIPWASWVRPLTTWGIFIFFYYLATFFITGILRKQWVDSERLIFPLARVPLELTEGSEQTRLLPRVLQNRAFLLGVAASFAFGLLRVSPVIFGAKTGWMPSFNLQGVLWGTPIEQLLIGEAYFYPIAIGFAFLVPADVALSVWLFYWLVHIELLVAAWMGQPITGGATGPFMSWQQAGTFIVFTLMMLWAARRHLGAVLRKAFGFGANVDDSREPISYRVSFWGLLVTVAAMTVWFAWFGMNVFSALALIVLIFCVALVQARLVAQGGIFFVQETWSPPQLLNGLTGGHAFSAPAAVVAQMQNAILIQDSREILSGHAVNALRISSVFEKHRRLFLPVMMVALIVAVGVCTYSTMTVYYTHGGLNTNNGYGMTGLPIASFNAADKMIANPARSAQTYFGGLIAGGVVMFFVTAMRARFYWWPLHSLGLPLANTWPARTLWFSFLLGWLIKVVVMRYGGGAMLRTVRNFFFGVIVAEATLVGISTVFGFMGIQFGNLFLPV